MRSLPIRCLFLAPSGVSADRATSGRHGALRKQLRVISGLKSFHHQRINSYYRNRIQYQSYAGYHKRYDACRAKPCSHQADWAALPDEHPKLPIRKYPAHQRDNAKSYAPDYHGDRSGDAGGYHKMLCRLELLAVIEVKPLRIRGLWRLILLLGHHFSFQVQFQASELGFYKRSSESRSKAPF